MKDPVNVTIPRHEYALLIAAKAKWDMIEKLVPQLDAYDFKKIMDLLIQKPEVE